jgi:hypothetical protein
MKSFTFAPNGGIKFVHFCKRGIEIEKANETGPLRRPITNGKNRPLMASKSCKYVMAILPYCFGYDHTSLYKISKRRERIYWEEWF